MRFPRSLFKQSLPDGRFRVASTYIPWTPTDIRPYFPRTGLLDFDTEAEADAKIDALSRAGALPLLSETA